MVEFDRFTLENGLKVVVHQDKSSPIVAFNIVYNVGAKDEDERKTGFAHLFEHLMFGGSVNISSFDKPLQEVGGDNNAFTSNDITNYYITLPKNSIETAFWLESDRMLGLAFTEKSLEVQRQVVIEEFKQQYLNQPYGDAFLLLRPLAYKIHPYKWATIGKDISHIESATMEDVKDFFYKHYRPNNAILAVVGDVSVKEIEILARKWFGNISKGDFCKRELPKEEGQESPRYLTVERNVPQNAIYKAYHTVRRVDPDYYTTDVISDILSRGSSSRFNLKLIKEKKVFTELDAYITGDLEEGLFIISGKLSPNVTFEKAEESIKKELELLSTSLVSDYELQGIKNKIITSHEFSISSVLNKAMSLAISELVMGAEIINEEIEEYNKVSAEEIKRVSSNMFRDKNCSTLYYKSKNSFSNDC